jgi:hypothetical protein
VTTITAFSGLSGPMSLAHAIIVFTSHRMNGQRDRIAG